MQQSPTAWRLRAHWLLVAVAIVVAAVLIAWPPPAAAESVDDFGALEDALDGCDDISIVLSGDIAEPGETLTIPCNVALDLTGNALDVHNVVIEGSQQLTIIDQRGGGSLRADASSTPFRAGIRTTGATLEIAAGTVEATGGRGGAGIGGDGGATNASGADGGDVTISGGTVIASGGSGSGGSAGGAGIGGGGAGDGTGPPPSGGDGGTLALDGGDVTATAGSGTGPSGGGAGFGGGGSRGAGGAGGSIEMNGGVLHATGGDSGGEESAGAGIGGGGGHVGTGGDGAGVQIFHGDVTAIGGDTDGNAVGAGLAPGTTGSAGQFGSLQTGGNLHLPAGSMRIGSATVGISSGGAILGPVGDETAGATITGSGVIQNEGVIGLAEEHVNVDVEGHHYSVTFETDGGTPDGEQVTVFAPTFNDGYRAFPADPTHPEFDFIEWSTANDGTGAPFDASSDLTAIAGTSDGDAVDVPVYAQYDRILVTIAFAGPGSGRVIAALSGESPALDCHSNDNEPCTAAFTSGSTIDLAAEADAGSMFEEWCDSEGACSGSPPAAPASGHYALTAVFATPLSTIEDQLDGCTGTTGSPTEIAVPGDFDTPDDTLTVPCVVDLDLAGHAVAVRNVIIEAGEQLTIRDTDTSSGGRLEADGGGSGRAGIRTTNAILIVEGGEIIARGGRGASSNQGGGSGIGGNGANGTGGDGGVVVINGGTVTASGAAGGGIQARGGSGIGGGGTHGFEGRGGHGGEVTITGGAVTASGSNDGAGIGGGGTLVGRGGDAGSLAISGGEVTATAGGTRARPVGGGLSDSHQAGDPGPVAVSGGMLHLPGGTMVIEDDGITIGAGGAILGAEGNETSGASFSGSGVIDNQGVLGLAAGQVNVPVEGHHYAVTFDSEGGTPDGEQVIIFAPTFDDGYREFPSIERDGFIVEAWNTEPDGSGDAFTASTTLTGSSDDGGPVTSTVYGQYAIVSLALDFAGDGDGGVTAGVAGEMPVLDCHTTDSGDCETDVPTGSTLDFTATPDPGSLFIEWCRDDGGETVCSDDDSRTLDLDETGTYAVTAVFSLAITALQDSIDGCDGDAGDPTSIALTEDISAPGTTLTIPCHVDLDLAGFDLEVQRVVIEGDQALRVDDSDGGGHLLVDGTGTAGLAAIRTTGATLTVAAGAVTATGGHAGSAAAGGGSGIGGDGGASGNAGGEAGHVTVEGGTVAATGGSGGAGAGGGSGIGGGGGGLQGAGGDGGSIEISGGTVTAVGGGGVSAGSAAGSGGGGVDAGHGAFGTLDISGGTLHLPAGAMRVPSGGTTPEITVGPDGEILGAAGDETTGATFTGDGTIANDGVIAITASHVTGSSEIGVEGHHYHVTFDSGGADTGDPGAVTLFAPTFGDGYRDFPADPVRGDFVFAAWTVDPDGAGDPVTASSTLPGTSDDGEAVAVALTAQYDTTYLAIEVEGEGEGRVTAGIPGGDPALDCHSDGSGVCAADFPAGSEIEFRATPDTGSYFDTWCEWNGDCGETTSVLTPRTLPAGGFTVSARFGLVPDGSEPPPFPGQPDDPPGDDDTPGEPVSDNGIDLPVNDGAELTAAEVAEAGATVCIESGAVEVCVEPGVLPAEHTLILATVGDIDALLAAAPATDGTALLLGFVLQLRGAGGEVVDGVDLDGVLTLRASLDSDAAVGGTDTVDLVTWTGDGWAVLPATVSEHADGTATLEAELEHLSIFAVQHNLGGTFTPEPVRPGVTLAIWSGGAVDRLPEEAQSYWIAHGGAFTGYIPGAPAHVNAGFRDRFPGEAIPAGTPMIVYHEP